MNSNKRAGAHELEASVDASLKFLPMDEIPSKLETDTDTGDFIAVNSICVLVDGISKVQCV